MLTTGLQRGTAMRVVILATAAAEAGLLLIAQVDPAGLSGGAGWVGAGLLGAVLGWLLLKHLPDKDRQFDKHTEGARSHVEKVLDRAMTEMATQRADHHEQLRQERENTERRHVENATAVRAIIEELKQSRHAIRDVGQQLAINTKLTEHVLAQAQSKPAVVEPPR